ncbi:MAG: dTMP kinase [Vicinamibacterales bacterium]
MRGSLIAFEGLDQSGKQTQAESLRDALAERGHRCEMLSFPAYETAIGAELHRSLHGQRDYTPDVMQLLYVANRHEVKPSIDRWLAEGRVVLCDRYVASTVAYGVAQGLDRAWLQDIQRFLPEADLTILLDITPDVAVARKAQGRDRFERDLALLNRVRDSYRRQAEGPRWTSIAAARPKEDVSADVRRAVSSRLGLL